MRKFYILLALVAGLFATPVYADFTAKDASAATITFKNPGVCTSVVCVPVFQLYDGTSLATLTTAGADAASNTLTGLPVYSRNLVFNGTTWDRWTGAVTATLAAETTKVIGTVRIASGGVASGSIASGAVAAGALASGAGVDGWNLSEGATTDAVVAAGATGSVQAKLRRLTTDLDAAKTSLASIDTKASLALPAQAGIGNVNIGAVQSAGSKYIAVAASQTATVLQASAGAAGDYLSHCVIYPTSTSPGVVTVFDNTNTAATSAILFAGGATSTSNLTPISVPVGAVSTAGAWKVTTGAAVSVVCYGKFS